MASGFCNRTATIYDAEERECTRCPLIHGPLTHVLTCLATSSIGHTCILQRGGLRGAPKDTWRFQTYRQGLVYSPPGITGEGGVDRAGCGVSAVQQARREPEQQVNTTHRLDEQARSNHDNFTG
eukprot:SM000020S06017  [mRNA]  locus=s20:403967:404870:- [translate_table: standard]